MKARADDVLGHVGGDLRGLLGPGDPQAAGRIERGVGRRQLVFQIAAGAAEQHDDVGGAAERGGHRHRRQRLEGGGEVGGRGEQHQVVALLDPELCGQRRPGISAGFNHDLHQHVRYAYYTSTGIQSLFLYRASSQLGCIA